MANRAYLYSVNEIPDDRKGTQSITVKGLSEFSYNIPPVFLILLGHDIHICNSLVGKSYALAGNYDQGGKNLEKFISMMLKNGVQHPENFKRISNGALTYLNRPDIKQKHILLEYLEIFEISFDENVIKNQLILPTKDLLVALNNGDLDEFNKYIGDDILTHWEDRAGINYWSDTLYFHFDNPVILGSKSPT